MKIVLLPLDERPCNYNYPLDIPNGDEINIVVPPLSLLSDKKRVCDLDRLDNWVIKETVDADYAVISLDTLIYGGIVPSRIHHTSLEDLLKRCVVLEKIKQNNKKIKIFCNELIMRCPSYSLSDEEPDYFDLCGLEIFKLGVLMDKEKQGFISKTEAKEKKELLKKINKKYLNDFLERRKKNIAVTMRNLEYLSNNIIDFFIIPQDDCSVYGFPSSDLRMLKQFVYDKNIYDKVVMYPGADEVGLTLISRAINDYKNYRPKIFVYYASELGKNAIPQFEDRPIDETMKYQIYATNSFRVYSLSEADICLAVNLGSEFVPFWDEKASLIYEKNKSIKTFVDFVEYALSKNKIVGIADVAYCNQADKKLVQYLSNKNMLFKIHGFAGWNTSSNTLGTTINEIIATFYFKNEKQKNHMLLSRYIEDYAYMCFVRDQLNCKINNEFKNEITIFNLGSKKHNLENLCQTLLIDVCNSLGPSFSSHIKSIKCEFIWNRSFEVKLYIEDDFQ
jgi:hypothetical protein